MVIEIECAYCHKKKAEIIVNPEYGIDIITGTVGVAVLSDDSPALTVYCSQECREAAETE